MYVHEILIFQALNKVTSSRTRIKDIANLAGVSIGTVDRVLHNRGEVSPTTRELILKLIDEKGYTPNLLAKSLSSKKKYTIDVLIPDYKSDNPYWEKPLVGIQRAGSELKNYNFDIQCHTFTTESSFRQVAEDVLASDPDGIIFAPHYYQQSLDIISKCGIKTIPYVFIDVDIDNCDSLAYFGQDATMSGYIAAKLLSLGMTQNSEVLVLKLINQTGANHHLNKREKGFKAFFSSSENIKNITVRSAEIDITSAETLSQGITTILTESTAAGGAFVINSRVHKVAKYFEERNINTILLVGYDLLDENIHYLEKNIIQFLICQKPEEQGYKSVMALFNHLILKKVIEKVNYSPVDIILNENRKFYNI